MPVQTTVKDFIFYPDGAKVSVKSNGETSFTDLGVIMSDCNCTFNFVEVMVDSANADKLDKHIKDMTMDISFELGNLDMDNIARLSGGAFTVVDTAGTANSSIPDQEIASGWSANEIYELEMETSSSDTTLLRMSTAPTITSVTLDADGTPEVLVANNDYLIVELSTAVSGYGIVFTTANIAKPSPTNYPITIDYGTNTPVASSTLYGGSSTVTLTSCEMKWTHTDSAGKVREIYFYKVDPNSGGFTFNFKSATADGIETMPVAMTARLDTSRTDGRQLFGWSIDVGAA